MLIIFLDFLFLSTIVVFAAKSLSKQAEILQKNLKFNPVFMGIILAAVTSLPEVVSSITSIYLVQDSMAVANILGSNVFNIFALAIFNLVFFHKAIFLKVEKTIFVPIIFSIVMYILFIFSFFATNVFDFYFPAAHFATTTILITIIYFYSLFAARKHPNLNEEKIETTVELKKVKLKFLISMVIIVISSVFLAHVADSLIEVSSLSSSAIGALLIGISTSLPEITTCYSLIKNGNYSMAISSVIGSNTFNFLTFTLLDYLTVHSIYKSLDKTVFYYAAIGLVFSLFIYLSEKISHKFHFIPSILIFITYIVLILISI